MSRRSIAAIALGTLFGVLAFYWFVIGRREIADQAEAEEAQVA